MPLFLSVLKLTGAVSWRNGSSGAFAPVQTCQTFDNAIAATAQFRLDTNNASIEIHQFESQQASPPCPTPHQAKSLLMVLNREPGNALKKRRASLKPRTRKAAGPTGKKKNLKRNGPWQSVQSGGRILEIRA